MRVLFVSSPEKGHVNPLVGVAQWLRREGHHVGWMCLPEPSPQIARAGFEVVEAHLPPRPAGAPELVTGGPELARLVRDEAALGAWIRTLLLDLVPAQIAPVRAALAGFRPDVVALDGMQYAAAIAAHLERVPWAGLSSALTLLEPPAVKSALLRHVRGLADERAGLFAAHGMNASFRTCEVLSPRLNTIFATRALVGEDAPVPPATFLVGPSLPREPRGDEPDPAPVLARLDPARRLVYLCFGSQISWQPEVFTRVAAAVAGIEGLQLVIGCGALAADADWVEHLPGDPVVVDYTPQRELLARAAVLVSHGGANSVMEAMSVGVPVLVSPVCNDQPVQAYYLGRAGAGLELDLAAASVEDVRAALVRLVAPGSDIAAGALAVAASYGRYDGAREAARLVARMGP